MSPFTLRVSGSLIARSRQTSTDEIGELAASVFQDPRSQFFTVNSSNEVAFGLENHGLPQDKIRWRVEEAFKRIKHRLGLEQTSGLSWHAARQDFGAKAVCDNLNALAAYVATDAHLDPDSPYKINRTQAFDKIKRQLGRWLLAAQATLRRVKSVLAELAKNLQKFVPDRANPHPARPKPHRHHAYKPI